jgi:transposase-like protein
VSEVARLRGINASQLFGWRRQALAKGVITDHRSEPSAAPALTFAAVEVGEEPATTGEEREVRATATEGISQCRHDRDRSQERGPGAS